jgi:hypothetical protein
MSATHLRLVDGQNKPETTISPLHPSQYGKVVPLETIADDPESYVRRLEAERDYLRLVVENLKQRTLEEKGKNQLACAILNGSSKGPDDSDSILSFS